MSGNTKNVFLAIIALVSVVVIVDDLRLRSERREFAPTSLAKAKTLYSDTWTVQWNDRWDAFLSTSVDEDLDGVLTEGDSKQLILCLLQFKAKNPGTIITSVRLFTHDDVESFPLRQTYPPVTVRKIYGLVVSVNGKCPKEIDPTTI